jgi:hypothetical protein
MKVNSNRSVGVGSLGDTTVVYVPSQFGSTKAAWQTSTAFEPFETRCGCGAP